MMPREPGGPTSPRNRKARLRSSTNTTASQTTEVSLTSWDGKDAAARRLMEREIFQKSRFFLEPGPFFRFIVYLYSERKLLVFFWIHFVSTIVIWVHFGLIKFDEQLNAVPDDADRYWWKRIAPPLEFGSMHAILFQMALLPLTMSRLSIATLSDTVLGRFVPFNRAVRIHIHLGYVMITIVSVATVFFFLFFGLLCGRDKDQAFCDKFTSEIMITGYVILGLLLIVGLTSYLRYKIPYELFYGMHHLVFVLYLVTIVHTFDVVQRQGGRERSQTFKWFTGSLLYYVCDRIAMRLNHTYRTAVVATSAVAGSNGSKMILLKLKRPTLFRFKPGQYAYLRMSQEISRDASWHPFSIASGPASDYLEFYIEVFDEKSWTGNLWNVVDGDGQGGLSHKRIYLEVMGPYGTCLAKTHDYTHCLAVGAGTGIVPILSLFKQHVRHLMRLEPDTYLREMGSYQRKIFRVERAEEPLKGSLAEKIGGACLRKPPPTTDDLGVTKKDLLTNAIRNRILRHTSSHQMDDVQGNLKVMKHAIWRATRSIYGIVLLTGLPVLGVAMLAFTLSWNTIPIDLYRGQTELLTAWTIIFQILFFVISVFIWDGNNFLSYIDLVFCIVSPLADMVWFGRYRDGELLKPVDMALYFLLIGYMTARVWDRSVRPRYNSWRTKVEDERVTSFDRLEIVWTTRSASLVSEVMPDINEIWNTLVEVWGEENASRVCRVRVYVTDKNERACRLLKRELRKTALFRSGNILFARPDLPGLIEDYTLDMVTMCRSSYSLLAFCGSAQFARTLHHHKISNDMIAAMTGNKKHQMEFVSESYGGVKAPDKFKKRDYQYQAELSDNAVDGLTTRTESRFFGGVFSKSHKEEDEEDQVALLPSIA